MLTKRVIPCLDVNAGRVVKGTSFTNLQDAGDPVELAAYYYEQGADEIVFLDIGATPGERNTIVDVVENVSKKVFIPLTVGGGLRDIRDMTRILKAGADKVSINTAAVFNPGLIEEGAKRFGSQCIVLAIDARRDDDSGNGEWMVYTHGGKKPADIDAVGWAKRAVDLGCGEILLTSWDADGHRSGYDLQLISAISESVTVPVIASGGAGEPQHLFEALTVGQADAVLVASIFHYHLYTIREVKSYLKDRGIPTRFDY